MKKMVLIFCFSFYFAFTQTSSNVKQADINAALNFHNKARKDVGVESIEWSDDLAKYAQEWANYLANNNKFMHRPHTGKYKQLYGENIFSGLGGNYNLIDACESWYSEIKYYKKSVKLTAQNWSKAGHYTQMVWRKSTKVGMGIAKGKNGKIYIVANYSPAGNMMGEKPY